MANHTCPSHLVENNNVKLTHNWGQPPRKPPEYEHMQSALKRRKALSFLSNQYISKFSNISTRVNAERKIKHLKTQPYYFWNLSNNRFQLQRTIPEFTKPFIDINSVRQAFHKGQICSCLYAILFTAISFWPFITYEVLIMRQILKLPNKQF
jgi:hypothetical protein